MLVLRGLFHNKLISFWKFKKQIKKTVLRIQRYKRPIR